MKSYFKFIDCFTKYVKMYKPFSNGKIICVLLEDFYHKNVKFFQKCDMCRFLNRFVIYVLSLEIQSSVG